MTSIPRDWTNEKQGGEYTDHHEMINDGRWAYSITSMSSWMVLDLEGTYMRMVDQIEDDNQVIRIEDCEMIR